MARLLELWQREPARVVAFVTAILAVAAAFGLPITDDQQVKTIAAVAAALFLLGSAEVTRSQVSSPATVSREKAASFSNGFDDGVTTGRAQRYAAPSNFRGDNLEPATSADGGAG